MPVRQETQAKNRGVDDPPHVGVARAYVNIYNFPRNLLPLLYCAVLKEVVLFQSLAESLS
jgi:hypothetical protein